MKFVTRAQWGARKPKYVNRGTLSAKSTGHWNGPTVSVGGRKDFAHEKCASLVRGIQNFHMNSRGWSDIAYNFVICPHGTVYEGRGLNVTNGANGTNTGNRTSHAIMWLSGQGNAFTQAEKQAFRECVKYVGDSTQAPDAAIGHRDHKSTECPGNERYNWIHAGMPVNSTPSGPKVLYKMGDRGVGVGMLQAGLNIVAKFRVPASGKGIGAQIPILENPYFGPMTKEAVCEFQRFLVAMWELAGSKGPKPPVDGIVTEDVSGALNYWMKAV